MMHLSLTMTPSLRQILLCPLCHQELGSRRNEQLDALIFGASKYAICPRCLQNVAGVIDHEEDSAWHVAVNQEIEERAFQK